jgi:hypothetical protein
MGWLATAPDGRDLEVIDYNGRIMWVVREGNGHAEIVGFSRTASGARLRACLAWKDSARKPIPDYLLEQTKEAA